MEMIFGPKGKVEFKDARIIFRNFAGRPDDYTNEGDRSFTLVIPNVEMAEELQKDLNRYGVGWNVRIKAPTQEGMDPMCTLKVKVKFNEDGPNPDIYLESNGRTQKMTADNVHRLDRINIAHADIRITPYDSERRGECFRTAYLDAAWIVQEIDEYAARFNAMNGDDDEYED